MHCRILYAFRWPVLGSIHGRYSTNLYLHWSVDVHSVRLVKRSRKEFVIDGSGLDWRSEVKRALVLSGLWATVGIWWYTVAGIIS